MAVLLSSKIPYTQSTFSPKGPVTFTVTNFPPIPRANASTVPSPPSAKGRTTTSASGIAFNIPFLIASPASKEDILPFNESIATITFIFRSPFI